MQPTLLSVQSVKLPVIMAERLREGRTVRLSDAPANSRSASTAGLNVTYNVAIPASQTMRDDTDERGPNSGGSEQDPNARPRTPGRSLDEAAKATDREGE